MAQIVLDKLAGVNGTTAELSLPTGEASVTQNVRNRPLTNWVKRQGVESVDTSSDPYLGIFDIELDGIIIPIIQTGGTLTFYPNIESDTWPTPDPRPYIDPLDGDGNYVLFLIEPLMRSLQEKRLRVGLPKKTWQSGNISSPTTTNLFFNPDGTLINGITGVTISQYSARNLQNVVDYWPAGSGTAQFPVNNLYKYDLAYMDNYLQQPFGTRGSQLVNTVRLAIMDLLNEDIYTADPEGESSIPYLDFVDINLPPASTRGNYRSTLTNMRNAFRLVFRVAISATAVNSTNSSSILDQRQGDEYSNISCNDAKTKAGADYDGSSFGPNTGIVIGMDEYTIEDSMSIPPYHAQLNSYRGRFKCDLTNYSGTNGYFYFQVSQRAQGFSNTGYAPVTADSFYHKSSDSFSTGGVVLSSVYGSEKPSFTTSCPLDSGQTLGWNLRDTIGSFQYAVFNVTLTNFF